MQATAIHPDSYYEDAARVAIQTVLEETEGKEPDEIRFLLRRAYPFGPLRKGQQYKVWNRMIHEEEAKLGLQKRTHAYTRKENPERKKLKSKFTPPATKDEFLAKYPEPQTIEEAALFLRRHTDTNLSMKEDHDKLRVTFKGTNADEHKVKHEYTAELMTDDPEDYESTYIQAAQTMHRYWIENEASKY